jgi:hypothetical protein
MASDTEASEEEKDPNNRQPLKIGIKPSSMTKVQFADDDNNAAAIQGEHSNFERYVPIKNFFCDRTILKN